MNILFGIQTTGNGHISRAQEILPSLMQIGHVTILLSGENKNVDLPCHHQLRSKGLSYVFNSNGEISISKTALNLKLTQFIKEVNALDLSRYDLILNDFEPVSAWAAKLQNRPCLSLSHQASFLSQETPRPVKRNEWVEVLMRYFAPSTSAIGFHFERYDHFILPPVIKNQIQEQEVVSQNHITVYLPAYSTDFLVKTFNRQSDCEWHIFSPQSKSKRRYGNVTVQPTSKDHFISNLCSSQGVVTAGGFELCAETMFLGKKLFSIPIKNQYEQLCNASALKKLGIHTALSIGPQFDAQICRWLDHAEPIKLSEIALQEEILTHIHQFIGNCTLNNQVA